MECLVILAVTSTSGIGYEIIHNTTANKRQSKMFKNIFKKVYNIHFIPPFFPQVTRSFHFDVQKSFGTFNKPPLEKSKLKNASVQSVERKLKTQVILSTLAKLSMTQSKSLKLQIKTQTSPTVAIPYLGLSIGTLELFLDLKCSKISCFCFCCGCLEKHFTWRWNVYTTKRSQLRHTNI